jgi:hypothetical protein
MTDQTSIETPTAELPGQERNLDSTDLVAAATGVHTEAVELLAA